MEEDIQNHSPTVMFRGTPCILILPLPFKGSVVRFETVLLDQ